MDTNEILHIAIAPPANVEANLIKELAAIVNKDIYATRLLLAGKIPRIIAHYQTVQAAESAAQRLRHLGLVVILCKDSELLQTSSPIFRPRALRFGEEEVVFQDNSGTARIIKTENVFLIIKGIAQTPTEKEVTTTQMKLNLPATLLTGGIPIRRKVKKITVETSVQMEYFVRLYHRKSPEPDVEITQYGFDYSCLGANMSTNTIANFKTLSAKIKELCPHSVFDDRLTESLWLGGSATMSLYNNDIQCKLIYLFHEAASDPDSYA